MKLIDELVHPVSFFFLDGKSKLIERIIDNRFSKKCQDQIMDIEWDVEDVTHRMMDTIEADLIEQA